MNTRYILPAVIFATGLALFGGQRLSADTLPGSGTTQNSKTGMTLPAQGLMGPSEKPFLEFFPKPPFYDSLLPGSLVTKVKVPTGLERNLLTDPVKKTLPDVSLGKTIYPVSINIGKGKSEFGPEDFLSFYLSLGGQLNFPENSNVSYDLRAKVLLNSPYLDAWLNTGQARVFLFGSYDQIGNVNPAEIPNKNPEQIAELLNPMLNKYGFSAGGTLVVPAPYNPQAVIFGVQANNIRSNYAEPTLEAFFEDSIPLSKSGISLYAMLSCEGPMRLGATPSGEATIGLSIGKDPGRTVSVGEVFKATPTSTESYTEAILGIN